MPSELLINGHVVTIDPALEDAVWNNSTITPE